MTTYYVYILTDPRTGQPFYVGKGTGNRMMYHQTSATRNYPDAIKPHHHRIREILAAGMQVVYDKVMLNVTEGQALNKERALIEHYGRVVTGTGSLLNLTRGGQRGGATEKPISQYTVIGEHVADYSSAKSAAEQVPMANQGYITQCCKGKRVSSGGFLWAYKGDPTPTYTKKYYRAVEQRSTITGELLNTFNSLTHAQLATGVKIHNISECCRGKSKTAGGFVWHYA